MAGEPEVDKERGWLGLPSRVRWAVRLVLTAAVSLVLGTVIEHVAEAVKHNSEQVKESFAGAERAALTSVGRLRPTALARLYGTALRPRPSELELSNARLMDEAEAAIARARPAHASLSEPLSPGMAKALQPTPPAAAPGSPPRTPRDWLPEPTTPTALGSPPVGNTTELSKLFSNSTGATSPFTRYSDQLKRPAAPPLMTAPAKPGPSRLPAPSAGVGGAAAFDRYLKARAQLDADAGPSSEEQVLGVRLHHWAGQGSGNWLSPGIALVDVLWTLMTRGAWAGRIVMVLQLLFGIACAAPLLAWLGDDKRLGGGGGPLLIIAGPFAVVGFGSLISLAVWGVMAAAHVLFGGFTHIPGLSIGLGAASFCCWHVGWRATELALGHPLERLIERV